MSSINLKSYYLESSNQNKIRNYVMTELSKKFNIQPVIGQLNERFNRITEVISNNVASDNKLNLVQNLDRINKITVDQLLNAFSQILVPYEKIQTPTMENKSIEPKNDDVNDLYSKLMNERDYTDNSPTNLSTPILQINKNSPRTTHFNLPTIPEDRSEPSNRNSSFVERIELLKQNRSTLMEQRNQVDVETRNQNYKQNVLGEQEKVNYNTDLENNQAIYNDNFNVKNVGTDLVSINEIIDQRFAEYKSEKSMDYRKVDRQFFFCSKDRLWCGPIINNVIQPALEPYRYRLQLNNNKNVGIYLQNRQRNISSIRIVAVYISISEITSAMPPYIFVYVPELENRVETSLTNRKYVFAILTKDDIIGNQLKYVNFLSNNYYDPTPLSEMNNMTFEILNPLGYLYNDCKDDLLISGIGLDDLTTPKYITITTNKVYKSCKYNNKDILIIQNFGFIDNSNIALKNYLNDPKGHTIITPTTTTEPNEYLQILHIQMPFTIMDNGTKVLDPMIIEFQSYLTANGNPYTNVYGALINLHLQPSVIMELTKLEPNSKEINQSKVTII
jgi:hypothetical protein